jgi:outer membrane protein assembly factor BamB
MVFWPNYTQRPSVYDVYSPCVIQKRLYFGVGADRILGVDTKEGDIVWQHQTQSPIMGGITFSNETAYYVEGETSLTALSLEDTSVRWTFQTEKRIKTLPTVANYTVYFGGKDKALYAVEAETGKVKWIFHAKGEIRSPATVGPDGTVYVGSFDNRLYALAGETGDIKWSFRTGIQVIYSAPAIDGDNVYFGSNDFYLYALDRETGHEKWRFKGGTWIRTFPVAYDGKVYFACYSEVPWDEPYYHNELCCLHADTGQLAWSKSVYDVFSGPYIAGGCIFICCQDGIFRALDLGSGDEKWRFGFEGGWVFDPAFSDGAIYLACADRVEPPASYPYLYTLATA